MCLYLSICSCTSSILFSFAQLMSLAGGLKQENTKQNINLQVTKIAIHNTHDRGAVLNTTNKIRHNFFPADKTYLLTFQIQNPKWRTRSMIVVFPGVWDSHSCPPSVLIQVSS